MIVRIGELELDFTLTEVDRVLTRIESSVGLKTPTPTRELLDALGQWLTSLGVVQCTRSIAWQVWWALYEHMDAIRKRHEVNAELAFWFNVDPFKLTDTERIGLLGNMDRCKAQSMLHNGKFSPTDYQGVYNLVLLATGDEAKALKARADAMERFVDSRIAKGR